MSALNKVREWLERVDPRVGVPAALALVLLAVLAFMVDDGEFTQGEVEPPGFAMYPTGDEVPRLSPIKITYQSPPSERDGTKLVSVSPAVEGDYAWLSERTLLFQPKYPGLLRGFEYTVKVEPRPEAGLAQTVERKFTTAGLLRVESVVPAHADTGVPGETQVLVQFSRSVAPLTLLSEQRVDQVVTFDPPLAGKGEWLNTSLYRFVPDSIEPNTKYTATVPAGLTAAADGVLKENFTWSFTTWGPAVESVNPVSGGTFASPYQQVAVKFNQEMDRGAVQAAVTLKDADGFVPAGAWAWNAEGTQLTFTPTLMLRLSTRYDVVVPKGLKGVNGGETALEYRTSFTTTGWPGINKTQPAAGATNAERWGIQIQFATPMDEKTFDGRVSVSGIEDDALRVYYSDPDRTMYLNVSMKPVTTYTVTLKAGITDRYGQPLLANSFSFTTGEMQPSLTFAVPNQVATYSASVEPVLYFHATNISEATFTLYPLTEAEAKRWQDRNHIDHPPVNRWVPEQPALRTWTQAVEGERNVVNIASTSLSGGGALPKGHYFVTSPSGQWWTDLVFSVVDTAIVLKVSNDEALAWALDHDTGAPVAGLALQATGEAVGGSATSTTNGDGLASFKLTSVPREWDSKGEPLAVRTSGGSRMGVASILWRNGADPRQLQLPYSGPQEFGFVGHLYTERPIYRPREDVAYKGVVRLDNDASYSVPASLPTPKLIITDAQGKELTRQDVTLNEFGSFAGTFALAAEATIGNYSVRLQTGEGDQRRDVSYASFQVAEFRKPEFQVTVGSDRAAYANGDAIAGNATATFFFGGALEGAATEWAVLSTPYFPSIKGYEGYSFIDREWWWRRPNVVEDVVRARGTTTTGPGGVASFSVPATITGNEGPQTYTIAATVTDQNAQAVANSVNVTVHPADVYAGIRNTEYVVTAGETGALDVVTVDTAGNVRPNTPFVLNIYDRKWVTTKEQTPEGTRRYRSDPVDTLVTSIPGVTNEKGEARVAVPTTKAGELRLAVDVTDSRGRTARAAVSLWVSGNDYAPWRITNDDLIELVADKAKYEVGDTAEILVPAPFTGAIGLVTTERGKIHTREVTQFPTNSERIRIPITDRGVPNVFVSVVLYRPPTAEDPVPRYKIGYVQLPVSTSTRQLNVSIEPDRAQAKPGDTVRYTIRVTNSQGQGVRSELSVAVVDKAVLSLADERGPNGLAAFWYQRPLGVATSSSLAVSVNRTNDVISEPKSQGKGGGGDTEDRLRQDFRNTAYWEAQLVTKEDGTATVDVKMPDNLTTWRLQARAISGDTLVGENTNELLSTQPLLLRPALPRFLRVSDSAKIRLLVRNATSEATDVKVALEAEGIDISGDTSRSVKVGAGESVMLEWPAKVQTDDGAKLTFSAVGSNGLKDAVVQELPVYLDVTPEAVATGGVVKDESFLEALYLPLYAILENGSLEVTVQPSLVGSLGSELGEFERRPWEKWEGPEKISSRVVANLAVRRADRSQGLDRAMIDGRIRRDLGAVLQLQKGDGGFAWCQPDCGSSPWITGIVLTALGEARHDGFEFDSSVLDRARSYVSNYVNRQVDVNYPADVNEKAFLIYALARAGNAEQALGMANSLFEQYRSQLANSGRAYLVLAMVEGGKKKGDGYVSQLLNDLGTRVVPSANGNSWDDKGIEGTKHSGLKSTAIVLLALVRADSSHPLIEETVRWIMVARGTQPWQWYSDRAQAILSLSEYTVSTGELGGNYDYRVTAGENELLSGHFSPGDGTKTNGRQVPLTDFTRGKVTLLEMARALGTPGRMYYTMNLRYKTPAREVEALNRGLAISHEYTLLEDSDTPVTSAKLGQTVRVTVTVYAPAQRNYVVVDDLLPAGLEPIDPKVKTTSPELKAKLDAELRATMKEGYIGFCGPWYPWYYSHWDQVDQRDDRVTLRANQLPKGVYEYVYYARATTPGDFFVAPPHAEEAFFPEVFGRGDSGRFVVEP